MVQIINAIYIFQLVNRATETGSYKFMSFKLYLLSITATTNHDICLHKEFKHFLHYLSFIVVMFIKGSKSYKM